MSRNLVIRVLQECLLLKRLNESKIIFINIIFSEYLRLSLKKISPIIVDRSDCESCYGNLLF